VALTIRDIAAAAGVSTATVSRALRGHSNVDARTRDRIVAIARKMNYSVSPAASRLATGRTGTIGIITPFVGSWYFGEMFAGVEEGLKPYDVDLLLHTTEPPEPTGQPGAHIRMRRRVDGALVLGLAANSEELKAMAKMDFPVVLLGSRAPGLSSVSIDDLVGARSAVQHLIDLGHVRIGLISGRVLPTRFLPENDRQAGYLEALTENGLPTDKSLREVGNFTAPGGELAMTKLLARRKPPTAVFCMSDEMAFGALQAISRAGLRPGGDRATGQIAVIGFDNHDLAPLFDLSTVGQQVRELGRSAAHLLMGYVSGATGTEEQIHPTELHVRASTSA
jgi:LacI family repressor for deo operon, udp, cdd, tsx, nupC, and nupG